MMDTSGERKIPRDQIFLRLVVACYLASLVVYIKTAEHFLIISESANRLTFERNSMCIIF